jgi:hypothetical protein
MLAYQFIPLSNPFQPLVFECKNTKFKPDIFRDASKYA